MKRHKIQRAIVEMKCASLALDRAAASAAEAMRAFASVAVRAMRREKRNRTRRYGIL